MYIFEQKDINSSKISDNGELIKQFYVDQKTFQEYLKDQLKKEEISLESDLLLKEFFHEMDTQNRLKEAGIPTAVHYPVPLHLQECFNYLGYKKGDFPISEIVSNEIMSLPMNPYVSDEEIEYIAGKL